MANLLLINKHWLIIDLPVSVIIGQYSFTCLYIQQSLQDYNLSVILIYSFFPTNCKPNFRVVSIFSPCKLIFYTVTVMIEFSHTHCWHWNFSSRRVYFYQIMIHSVFNTFVKFSSFVLYKMELGCSIILNTHKMKLVATEHCLLG